MDGWMMGPDDQLELAKNATNTRRVWKTAGPSSLIYRSARGIPCADRQNGAKTEFEDLGSELSETPAIKTCI